MNLPNADTKGQAGDSPAGASDTPKQSRREFVRNTSAAALGVAVAASHAFAAEPPAKRIRMAVVGGHFGRSFFWHELPQCVVEAVIGGADP